MDGPQLQFFIQSNPGYSEGCSLYALGLIHASHGTMLRSWKTWSRSPPVAGTENNQAIRKLLLVPISCFTACLLVQCARPLWCGHDSRNLLCRNRRLRSHRPARTDRQIRSNQFEHSHCFGLDPEKQPNLPNFFHQHHQLYTQVLTNKHEDVMAHYGVIPAQSIMCSLQYRAGHQLQAGIGMLILS